MSRVVAKQDKDNGRRYITGNYPAGFCRTQYVRSAGVKPDPLGSDCIGWHASWRCDFKYANRRASRRQDYH